MARKRVEDDKPDTEVETVDVTRTTYNFVKSKFKELDIPATDSLLEEVASRVDDVIRSVR